MAEGIIKQNIFQNHLLVIKFKLANGILEANQKGKLY